MQGCITVALDGSLPMKPLEANQAKPKLAEGKAGVFSLRLNQTEQQNYFRSCGIFLWPRLQTRYVENAQPGSFSTAVSQYSGDSASC